MKEKIISVIIKHVAPYKCGECGGLDFSPSNIADEILLLIKPKKGKKDFTPPTLNEVIQFFHSKGYDAKLAQTFFDGYENGNPPWHDSRGNPVISWKQKAIQVWFKDSNKIANNNQSQMVR